MKSDSKRAFKRARKATSGPKRINTTIYDLIMAVSEEAGAEESRLVPLVVKRLLGKAKHLSSGLTCR